MVPLTARIVEIRDSAATNLAFAKFASGRRRGRRRKMAIYLWISCRSMIDKLLARIARDHWHVWHVRHGWWRASVRHHGRAPRAYIWRVRIWMWPTCIGWDIVHGALIWRCTIVRLVRVCRLRAIMLTLKARATAVAGRHSVASFGRSGWHGISSHFAMKGLGRSSSHIRELRPAGDR